MSADEVMKDMKERAKLRRQLLAKQVICPASIVILFYKVIAWAFILI